MNKTRKIITYMLMLFGVIAAIFMLSSSTALAASVADPTGASYIATTGEETLNDIATTANKALYGSNYVWIMICAFMVFFFQCGFAMVETGFCRAKNAAHTMTMKSPDCRRRLRCPAGCRISSL